MIGLIVTGHGKFATGMKEALAEISQEPEFFEAVDYELSESHEELSCRLEKAMDALKECESILVLSDLAGGAPFKEAVELGQPRGYEMIAGTNLGMLVEVNLMRQFMDDVHALAAKAITVGKDKVLRFE